AGLGHVEEPEQIQQRALAGAGGAGEAHHLAPGHVERHAAQGAHHLAVGPVIVAHVAHAEERTGLLLHFALPKNAVSAHSFMMPSAVPWSKPRHGSNFIPSPIFPLNSSAPQPSGCPGCTGGSTLHASSAAVSLPVHLPILLKVPTRFFDATVADSTLRM